MGEVSQKPTITKSGVNRVEWKLIQFRLAKSPRTEMARDAVSGGRQQDQKMNFGLLSLQIMCLL